MRNIFFVALIFALVSCKKDNVDDQMLSENVYSEVGDKISLSSNMSESELINAGAISIKNENTVFYAGYQQVSGNNQNPIVYRFDNGELIWQVNDYETTGDDGSAYGILWNGGELLYVVFSATGTQGDIAEDYRRFCNNGWLKSYGSGGGAEVAIIAQINPETGKAENGTFLYAKKSDGSTNSLKVKSLGFDSDFNIHVVSDSWYSPLNIDKSPFTCSGDSPFEHTIVFDSSLQNALEAKTDRCE